MNTFPIFIEVGGTPPLVVGSGDLAIAKARALSTRAPRVTIAAAELPDALADAVENGSIEWLAREPDAADLQGRPLVVSATGSEKEDQRVSALARALGVPVNVPDKPDLCTFTFGAFVERGDVTVAISTDGAAPILATHLRGWLERELHPRLGRVAAIAREYRAVAKSVPFGAARRQFWQEVLTGAPSVAIENGDEAGGRRLIQALLDGTDKVAPRGRVILVGAGPGDPELMTLKAVRAMKSADVVLYDDLVGDGVLAYARREATLIGVGKRGGKPSAAQVDINAAMIEHARAGKIVVRLKGGDAFVFGRAAEEIAAVEAAGITVDIIPGLTSAQACAADARLPLTYRGKVRQITFVTGATGHAETDLDWAALARPGQPLAIYMGVKTAPIIVRELIGAGADPRLPAVIVENGGLPESRTIATSLFDLAGAIDAHDVTGPAILFLGLDWFEAGLDVPDGVEFYSAPVAPYSLLGNRFISGSDRARITPVDQLALSL